MQIVLVRHALPERVDAPPDGSGGAPADPDLTELGQRQAQRLVAAIGPDVAGLYSSSMVRARATAEPLARALGRSITVLDGLREYDTEIRYYVPVHEMARRDPESWQRMVAGYLPGQIDTEAFADRVGEAIEQIIAAHPGRKSVVVVAHAGVINIWLARLLRLDRPLMFPIDYTGITRVLAGRDGRRVVRSVNETGHVADLLVMPTEG